MLVYGDQDRLEPAEEIRTEVRARLRRAAGCSGLERHAALVGAFIRAAELAQAEADALFAREGRDRRSDGQDGAARLLCALGGAIDRSWTSGFRASFDPGAAIRALVGPRDDAPVRTRQAEGYAFYALYPEAVIAAAHHCGLGADTRLIGIRSIGLGLAALVAAALAAAPPVSLRPVGHPFRRTIAATPELARDLVAAAGGARFGIADEGPGLSGSSFAAVAAWLEEEGVAPSRIHFFPSHDSPPGPAADAAIRARWRAAPRHPAQFSTILRADVAGGGLAGWIAGLVGPLDAPLEDISGGGWRRHGPQRDAPFDPRLERRKFLVRSAGGVWLARFAGLGASGEAALERALALHRAGFVPEPAGLVHGFLVERWVDGAPLTAGTADRQRLVEHLGRYLGFRARALPASSEGAAPAALAAMARHNVETALGRDVAVALDRRLGPLDESARGAACVDTDNRMHRWEWLVTAGGTILKTDAVDHAHGHDLIGCQPVEWDVAGAIVEHELTATERDRLVAIVAEEAGGCSPALVAALLPAYLAFQLGLWTMAAEAGAEEGAAARAAAVSRYENGLRALVAEAV